MNYTIDTNKSLLDIELIHDYLSNQSYWAKGITKEKVEKVIKNSLCFGVYANDQQVGLARVVTDYVRMAYLADVFILKEHQGKGVGKQLMKVIMEYPALVDVSRWALLTKDAHGLYRQFGFVELSNPEWYMEIDRKLME